ncbi:MAG: hypothetical protein U0Q18_08450 [Bryobacteraceae bacterium]
MKRLFCTLILAALTLTAGDLSGKWSGAFDITKSSGETESDSAYLNLKVDGATVTGTAGPNEDKQWTIQKGKLEGYRLTFEVVTEDGGSVAFDLALVDNTLRGTANGTGDGGEKMSAKVDLKRVS